MTYSAIKLSASEGNDPSKSGFETENLAWNYVESHRCSMCVEEALSEDLIFACDAEWMVCEDE